MYGTSKQQANALSKKHVIKMQLDFNCFQKYCKNAAANIADHACNGYCITVSPVL